MSPWSQFVMWGNCPRIFSARRRTLDLMQKLVPNDYCPSPEMIAKGRAISLTIPKSRNLKVSLGLILLRLGNVKMTQINSISRNRLHNTALQFDQSQLSCLFIFIKKLHFA